jgi:hypothetical protein
MTPSAADRLAILDVITRADEAASRRDADSYVALFAPDAVECLYETPKCYVCSAMRRPNQPTPANCIARFA